MQELTPTLPSKPTELTPELRDQLQRALRDGISRGRGSAFFNIGALADREIIALLPQTLGHVAVRDLLAHKDGDWKPSNSGLILSGFSDALPASDDKRVQALARGRCESYHRSTGLVVLSSTLPNVTMFSSLESPWWGGPLDRYGPVFQIEISPRTVQMGLFVLKKAGDEAFADSSRYHWERTDTVRFSGG